MLGLSRMDLGPAPREYTMARHSFFLRGIPRRFTWAMGFCIGTILLGLPLRATAEDKKQRKGPGFAPPASRPTAPPAPRSALLTSDAWRNAPLTPVTSQEIDAL